MDEKDIPPSSASTSLGWLKRTRIINDRSFQLGFVAHTLAMSAVMMGVMYFAIHSFFSRSYLLAESMRLPPDHFFYQMLNEQRQAMNILFAISSVLILCFMALGGLYLSHRVAGPLFRVKEHLRKMADGEQLPEISFRRHDYFQEMAENINKLLKRLNQFKS